MQKDKFEQILDEVAETWFRATDLPGQGIKIAEQSDVEGAFPVVVKHKTCYTTCSWCGLTDVLGKKTYQRTFVVPDQWRARCLDCKEIRFLSTEEIKKNK